MTDDPHVPLKINASGMVEAVGRPVEAKHTPGPWKVSHEHHLGPDGMVDAWRIRTTNDVSVATQRFFGDDMTVGANARLIAAAPEMLEALKALTGDAKYSGLLSSQRIEMARAAIAKAEGASECASAG